MPNLRVNESKITTKNTLHRDNFVTEGNQKSQNHQKKLSQVFLWTPSF